MYKELIAELRDYDGPVIYEDADGQHVECTAVDLTRQAAEAIDKLRAEQQEMMDLLSDITQKYDTCVKIQCQMTEVSNALQSELERVKRERDAAIDAVGRMAEYIVTYGRVDYMLCDDIPNELHLKYQPLDDGNYDNEPCIECVREYFMRREEKSND